MEKLNKNETKYWEGLLKLVRPQECLYDKRNDGRIRLEIDKYMG
jgi:hypothetical protein